MIKLKFGPYSADLENGVWSSRSARLTAYLNTCFSQEMYPDTPSSGIVGSTQVLAAQQLMGGEIMWPPTSLTPADRVY